MINKLIEAFAWVIGGLFALTMVPCLVGATVRAVGIAGLLIIFGILCVVAYLRTQSRPPLAARRKNGSGAERTPLAPRGDD